MTDREDQLRRDAAAMAEAVGRELGGAFQPSVDHAKRVRDMAVELTVIAGRTGERVERLSAGGKAGDPALSELLAFSEIVRSLAGQLRAMAERSVHDLDELKGQIVHTVRGAVVAEGRRETYPEPGPVAEPDIGDGAGAVREIRD